MKRDCSKRVGHVVMGIGPHRLDPPSLETLRAIFLIGGSHYILRQFQKKIVNRMLKISTSYTKISPIC